MLGVANIDGEEFCMLIAEAVTSIFSYSFLVRAFVVGTLVSLCASLLGVSLVLKRYSMIGDGLSHVGFSALAVASALSLAPLAVAIPVVLLASFVLLRLDNKKLMGDSAIAVISSAALAIGVLCVSLSGTNTDLESYMFGSIMAISDADAYLSIALSVILLAGYVLFYNRIFAVTFDESFSRATGIRTNFFNTLIAVLTAITVVLGMRMMGALLISSLIIFPCLCARKLCSSFKAVCICSGLISVLCFFVGMVASYVLGTPTGASIVAVNVIALVLSCLVGWGVRNVKGAHQG